jgi:hypothetical protein
MLQGYRLYRVPGPAARTASADFARRSPQDNTQAMIVALGFYLFGHIADLATTLGFLRFGMPECNPLPALVLQHGGLPALVALKVIGAIATTWVLWRLRHRTLTVAFACIAAVLLIYVASVNSLDVLDALARASSSAGI